MAKQFIISAMEETLGEYVLNIPKDKLKIAALRGQLTIENVQLDGDLVGSHVLGAVGLSGYGVLSCSAKSIVISIPWKQLETEPTKFEIRGVHMIGVPLTPLTANQMYGTGTIVDPRCTLRTRAKRLVLARLERNYWNGLIPHEGPVMKRIQRAVKEVERDQKLRSSSKTRKREKSMSTSTTATVITSNNHNNNSSHTEESEMEELINNMVHNLGAVDTSNTSNQSVDLSTDLDESSCFPSTTTTTTTTTADDLPELPRDWKVKLREKILRNIEASFHDVHIRLEVPEHGLELTGGLDATVLSSPPATSPSTAAAAQQQQQPLPSTKRAEHRAFALGFTLERLVIRTANRNWEVGSHEKRSFVEDNNNTTNSDRDPLGPNEYVTFNNKIGYFHNLSMYWDDEPSILLSETDALQGNYRKHTPEKLQTKIIAAMDALTLHQDPGTTIRQSLSARIPLQEYVGCCPL
jgi:N-terminal region of Chorein or VPS13/Vacuolar sorting-associated protein 13, N-terminal